MNVSDIRPAPAQQAVLKKQAQPAGESSFENRLKNISTDAPRANGAADETKEQPALLTKREQDYFEQLFPDAAEEVRSYNPYQRDRDNIGMKLGTLVDRKG